MPADAYRREAAEGATALGHRGARKQPPGLEFTLRELAAATWPELARRAAAGRQEVPRDARPGAGRAAGRVEDLRQRVALPATVTMARTRGLTPGKGTGWT